ncbi:hypothetical protein F183_A04610 [Bryobacterales bacterium F-183]|nr:hypothetical protein F183_A04610 [Bryobacterales bacterium F-183]
MDAYHGAEAIFVGDVTAVLAKRFPYQNRGFVAGQSVTVRVREAFKGFALGEELTFDNVFSSCDGEFQQGEQVLFRMSRDRQNGRWHYHSCETRRLQYAAADLVFLRAFRGVPGKHRVAGAVELFERSAALGYRRVAGLAKVPVRIVSGEFKKALVTNAAGVFEAYDVPPGRYRVQVEPPPGLKIRDSKKDIWIDITGDASVEVGVELTHDRTVFGKVLDRAGRPLEGVRVDLWLADLDTEQYSLLRSHTAADGSYRIENVPPGAYWIVANPGGRVTARSPIPRTYYPGVEARSEAHVIQLQSSTRQREVDLHIPKAAARVTLRGRLQFADGTPVPWTDVKLLADGAREHDSVATNERGEFRLFALAGSTGYLQAEIFALLTHDEIAASGCSAEWRREELRSDPLKVTASQDRDSIVLIVPVPACKTWLGQQRKIQEMRARAR